MTTPVPGQREGREEFPADRGMYATGTLDAAELAEVLEFLKKDGWSIVDVKDTDVPRVMIEFAKRKSGESRRQALEEAARSEEELIRELVEKQKLIHHGQYHQWNPFEICRDKECVRIRALVIPQAGEEGT